MKLAQAVLRDYHQGEEVAQDVLLELWLTASRFDPAKGSARMWISTMTHRRAVDRVRHCQAERRRDHVSAGYHEPAYDVVVETAQIRLDAEQVRLSLQVLTPRQRSAVMLAFYGGYSYPQVASRLALPLATTKCRIRDGLIRLREWLEIH